MATTSITGKQYPSVTQMTGIFGELHRRKMAEESLALEKKRIAMYGDKIAADIKHQEQQAMLLKSQQEALNMYRANQQMMSQLRLQFDMKKEQQDTVDTAIDLINKRREAKLSNMKPGDSETDDEFTQDYGSLWQQLNAMGLDAEQTGQILGSMQPLSKPEVEITPGQKFQVLANMPKKGMDEDTLKQLSEKMTEISGVSFTPEMLKRQEELEPEQRGLMSQVVNLIADKRLSPADVPKLMEDIGNQQYGQFSADLSAVIKPELPKAMSSAEMVTMIGWAKTEEQRYEILADNRTARTGREHHGILNTAPWFNKWEVADYAKAKLLFSEGSISLEHLQKYNDYWEEKETKTSTKETTKTTSGGFKY